MILTSFFDELRKYASEATTVTPAPPPTDPLKKYKEVLKEKKASMPWLASASAEHATDLGGLGLMAASSADKLRSIVKHKDEEKGSLVVGEVGRSSIDLAGLTGMVLPSLAALRHTGNEHAAGGGSRFTNIANALSLGALAAPVVDNIQAKIRARGGDPEKKLLLGHGAHQALELGGLAGLAGTVGRGMARGDVGKLPGAALLGGYGTLAAPVIDDIQAHARTPHGEDVEKKKYIKGALKPATELAGLGMLAAPSIATLGSH